MSAEPTEPFPWEQQLLRASAAEQGSSQQGSPRGSGLYPGTSVSEDDFIVVSGSERASAPRHAARPPVPAISAYRVTCKAIPALDGVYTLTGDSINGMPSWAAGERRLYATQRLGTRLWTLARQAAWIARNGGVAFRDGELPAEAAPPHVQGKWRTWSSDDWKEGEEVQLKCLTPCSSCSGSGSHRFKCNTCTGSGKRTKVAFFLSQVLSLVGKGSCPDCEGRGEVDLGCGACYGTGWVNDPCPSDVMMPSLPRDTYADLEVENDELSDAKVDLMGQLAKLGYSRRNAFAAAKRCGTLPGCIDWIAENSRPWVPLEATEDCCICYTPEDKDTMVWLDCSEKHWICRPCLREHFVTLIKEHRVKDEDLKCPGGCSDDVTNAAHLVQAVVSPEDYQKFLDRRLLREFAQKSEKIVSCPDCNFMVECPTVRDRYNVKCRKSGCLRESGFCGMCGEMPPHLPDVSCEEHRRRMEAQQLAPSDEELRKMGVTKCPSCGMGVIRKSACKFMKCDKKVGGCGQSFCYLCGKKTTRGEYDDKHQCVQSGYAFMRSGASESDQLSRAPHRSDQREESSLGLQLVSQLLAALAHDEPEEAAAAAGSAPAAAASVSGISGGRAVLEESAMPCAVWYSDSASCLMGHSCQFRHGEHDDRIRPSSRPTGATQGSSRQGPVVSPYGGAPSPYTYSTPAASGHPPNPYQQAGDEQRWRCSKCTFENSGFMDRCEVCEAQRGLRSI
eukprot:Hpha_TRINITY_DN10884_c0_g1::TRINITY_DN10884_c0_g1_i1::g.23239::m.23239